MSTVNRLEFEDDLEIMLDSEDEYGVVVLDIDKKQKEVQNVTTQTWYGENGEEAYIPSAVKHKAYDYSFVLGVKATADCTAYERKDAFVNAIQGKVWASIYQPCKNVHLLGGYLTNVEDEEVEEDFITFKTTFRVTNP